MTGEPEDVPPLARVAMPDVEQHGYRVYPLVDLVAIATGASMQADAQAAALASEAQRRGLELPRRFDVPARDLWERGYPAEAKRSLLPLAHTLDEALAVVRPFVDPLLNGTAAGAWNPKVGAWDPDGG